jgi:hypothetical protein
MMKLLLTAGLCAAAGLAHAQSPPSSPATAPVMSGSIDQAGDISLKAPKYNLNLPEVVGAPSKGVDASAITAYRVSPPGPANQAKPKRWIFNGDDQSANSYIQDNHVGQLNVDGYDNTDNDPED